MAYSIGVEYSLHCLVYLIGTSSNSAIGIKELAEFQGVSETYLSKMFGKLSKAGIVHSVPGVKGGYRLARYFLLGCTRSGRRGKANLSM